MKEVEKKKANTWGHWTAAPRRTTTLVCSCSARYIKTRPGQMVCLACAHKAAEAEK